MEYKIALLLRTHYRKFCEEEIKKAPDNVKLDYYLYDSLSDLQEIFQKVHRQYDGFYVSGLIPYQAIKTFGKEGRKALIEVANIDIANSYRILIQHLVGANAVSLSRIGMDFLRFENNLEEVILQDRFAEVVHDYEGRWKNFKTLEEIEEEEQAVVDFYKQQYEKNAIDLIITYFHSACEAMEQSKIPCYYVYAGSQAFWQSIENLKNNIALQKMESEKSAVICIDKEEMRDEQDENFEAFEESLLQYMQKFNVAHYNQFVVKNGNHNVELYMDQAELKALTKNFVQCPLYTTLNEKLGFEGSIGYGVGANLYQARINAINASRYGRNGGKKAGGSFYIDEKENLVVLNIGKEEKVVKVAEGYIEKTANAVKLSAETIVRIIGVMKSLNSNEITSHDLVYGLNISMRNANKFLLNLEKYQYAEIIGYRRIGNKGRPTRVYRLKLQYEF